jgi:hypothetical protein
MGNFGRSTLVLKPAIEAIRLLGRWRNVASGHMVLAAGCSCGAGTAAVRVQDYEQDILGFLRSRHPRAAGAADLAALLGAIAKQADPGDRALLEDLERSIASFEELHRGGRAS